MKPFLQIFSKKKTKLQGKKNKHFCYFGFEKKRKKGYVFYHYLSKFSGQVFECPEMDETFFFDLKATPHVFKGENKNDFMVIIDHNPKKLTAFFRRLNLIRM